MQKRCSYYIHKVLSHAVLPQDEHKFATFDLTGKGPTYKARQAILPNAMLINLCGKLWTESQITEFSKKISKLLSQNMK